jgi:hypothetical protein
MGLHRSLGLLRRDEGLPSPCSGPIQTPELSRFPGLEIGPTNGAVVKARFGCAREPYRHTPEEYVTILKLLKGGADLPTPVHQAAMFGAEPAHVHHGALDSGTGKRLGLQSSEVSVNVPLRHARSFGVEGMPLTPKWGRHDGRSIITPAGYRRPGRFVPQHPTYGTPNFILPPPNTDQLREAIEREVRRVLQEVAPGTEPGIILDVLVDLRVADQVYQGVDVNIGVIHTLSSTPAATATEPAPAPTVDWEVANWYIDPAIPGSDTTLAATMYQGEFLSATEIPRASLYWNPTNSVDEQIYRREVMSTIPEPEPAYPLGVAGFDWLATADIQLPTLFPTEIQPIGFFPETPQRKDLHPMIRAVLHKKDPHGKRCVCNDCMDMDWRRGAGKSKPLEHSGATRSVWQRLRDDYALFE